MQINAASICPYVFFFFFFIWSVDWRYSGSRFFSPIFFPNLLPLSEFLSPSLARVLYVLHVYISFLPIVIFMKFSLDLIACTVFNGSWNWIAKYNNSRARCSWQLFSNPGEKCNLKIATKKKKTAEIFFCVLVLIKCSCTSHRLYSNIEYSYLLYAII